MCTAVTYLTRDFYFGRNLDYERSFGESVTITPRNYRFLFRNKEEMKTHYAMIGMAHVQDNYPLYYDAINEKGLGVAGLNFVGNAKYMPVQPGKENVAQFELIPWILGKCATVAEAKKLLENCNITDIPFCEGMPIASLHWIIADRKECITVESMEDGIHVYENPVGILSNNPPFPMQMFALNNYAHLSAKSPEPVFAGGLGLNRYSRGLGGLGLPGDLSSQSRFVRAAFVKMNSKSGEDELSSVNQFFHILKSVEQQRGCCELNPGEYEITIYSSCCNADRGIYYYTTYENGQITGVDLHKTDLDSDKLTSYELVKPQISWAE